MSKRRQEVKPQTDDTPPKPKESPQENSSQQVSSANSAMHRKRTKTGCLSKLRHLGDQR